MARTAGRRTWQPWPLAQARQIRPATPVVPEPGPGRQSLLKQPERRKPNRRSGRDPGRRPYAPAKSKPGRQGRKHCTHPPCRIGRRGPRAIVAPPRPLCAHSIEGSMSTATRRTPSVKPSNTKPPAVDSCDRLLCPVHLNLAIRLLVLVGRRKEFPGRVSSKCSELGCEFEAGAVASSHSVLGAVAGQGRLFPTRCAPAAVCHPLSR